MDVKYPPHRKKMVIKWHDENVSEFNGGNHFAIYVSTA